MQRISGSQKNSPRSNPIVVATDLDRTFSQLDLRPSPASIERAAALRSKGIVLVLVTGRHIDDPAWLPLAHCFDAMVMEGGAAWGQPGAWKTAAVAAHFWNVASRLASSGYRVEVGQASFSAPKEAAALLDAETDRVTWRENAEHVDVTPLGVDKAFGLKQALRDLGLSDARVIAIGDGLNDVPLLASAEVGIAVSNAHESLLQAATVHAPWPAHEGFLWATRPLLHESDFDALSWGDAK